MTSEEPERSLSYEELFQQNLTLRRELDEAQVNRHRMGEMLVGMSRRLQASSASIKAAVSSLLGRDIFWDNANQHEFLKTIEASIDQADGLITLLVLISQAETGSLRPKIEPQMLQEILSFVQDRRQPGSERLVVHISAPPEGKPVLADFQYLMIALELLFEVFQTGNPTQSIEVRATETAKTWWLDFEGLDPAVIALVQRTASAERAKRVPSDRRLLDGALQLFVIRDLLAQQRIQIEVLAGQNAARILRLIIPAVESAKPTLPESQAPGSD
jgi:hypothetical protein